MDLAFLEDATPGQIISCITWILYLFEGWFCFVCLFLSKTLLFCIALSDLLWIVGFSPSYPAVSYSLQSSPVTTADFTAHHCTLVLCCPSTAWSGICPTEWLQPSVSTAVIRDKVICESVCRDYSMGQPREALLFLCSGEQIHGKVRPALLVPGGTHQGCPPSLPGPLAPTWCWALVSWVLLLQEPDFFTLAEEVLNLNHLGSGLSLCWVAVGCCVAVGLCLSTWVRQNSPLLLCWSLCLCFHHLLKQFP